MVDGRHILKFFIVKTFNFPPMTWYTPYLALTGQLWYVLYWNWEKYDSVITTPHCIALTYFLVFSLLAGSNCQSRYHTRSVGYFYLCNGDKWHPALPEISLRKWLSKYLDSETESRADSRFAPSQWEAALLCNDVSHWLAQTENQSCERAKGTSTGWNEKTGQENLFSFSYF